MDVESGSATLICSMASRFIVSVCITYGFAVCEIVIGFCSRTTILLSPIIFSLVIRITQLETPTTTRPVPALMKTIKARSPVGKKQLLTAEQRTMAVDTILGTRVDTILGIRVDTTLGTKVDTILVAVMLEVDTILGAVMLEAVMILGAVTLEVDTILGAIFEFKNRQSDIDDDLRKT